MLDWLVGEVLYWFPVVSAAIIVYLLCLLGKRGAQKMNAKSRNFFREQNEIPSRPVLLYRNPSLVRLCIVGVCALSGTTVYAIALCLAYNESAYAVVFNSPFRPIALAAYFVVRNVGIGLSIAFGAFLGMVIVAFLLLATQSKRK